MSPVVCEIHHAPVRLPPAPPLETQRSVGPRTIACPPGAVPVCRPSSRTSAARACAGVAAGHGWPGRHVPSLSRVAMPATRTRGPSAHHIGPSPSHTRMGVQRKGTPAGTTWAAMRSKSMLGSEQPDEVADASAESDGPPPIRRKTGPAARSRSGDRVGRKGCGAHAVCDRAAWRRAQIASRLSSGSRFRNRGFGIGQGVSSMARSIGRGDPFARNSWVATVVNPSPARRFGRGRRPCRPRPLPPHPSGFVGHHRPSR